MKIGVIGLGYVGLVLAVAFSEKFKVFGFDIDKKRIKELDNCIDKTLELSKDEIENSIKNGIKFSSELLDLKDCNFFIVCVPTPIDKNKKPNLDPIVKASKSIAKILKKNDIVVYESTVYPGLTEEICVKILEQDSGLVFNKDFFCGYSPERVNPGDKEHKITNIKKIVSGSNSQTTDKIDEIYRSIIKAGTHKAPSIKIAEAAKIIENTQRDINIAFVNELAMLFKKMQIDTSEVLKAASTKWNFLNFYPGLVGGHCIGVDPYYLTHKAKEIGFDTQMILAGRKINDYMPIFVANDILKLLAKKSIIINNSRLLILGLSFKQNCPDIRNSKIIDLVNELRQFNIKIDIFDPIVDKNQAFEVYNIDLLDDYNLNNYDCIVLAVAHNEFKKIDFNNYLVYDVVNMNPHSSFGLQKTYKD